MKKQLSLVLLLFLAFGICNAQKTTTYGLPTLKEYDRWSAGITVGISHLLSDMLSGDLSKNRVINQGDFQPAIGLQVHHQLSHSIGMRIRGMVTTFKGFDKDYLDSHDQPVFFTTKSDTILTAEKFKTSAVEGALEMT